MLQPLTTLVMMLAFCAVHLFIGTLTWLDRSPRSRWLSFAGGVAVAYVFLHIMPELSAHAMVLGERTSLGGKVAVGWVYSLSLAGLILFYGIERTVAASKERRMQDHGEDLPHHPVFWMHIAASGLLMAIIAYLLNHREETSLASLALFFIAMMLHLVTADFGTRKDHPALYDARGRWALVAATATGWGLVLLVKLPETLIGCMFAFVGGGVVLLVLKEELPEQEQSAFLPFLAGALIYAGLVVAEAHLTA